MRVAVSVLEGVISSTLLLRRLRAGSRENATYTAFREVGRVIRTVQLLCYLSDAPLRRQVTAVTACSPRRTTRTWTSASARSEATTRPPRTATARRLDQEKSALAPAGSDARGHLTRR